MASRSTLHFSKTDQAWLGGYLPTPESDGRDTTLPFVTLTFATSLDSALSLAPGTQTALSGPQSKAMTHYLRSRHDAILVGVGTAVADNPSLNCRLDGVGGYGGRGLSGQPRPIVIDPNGRWHLDSNTKVLNLAREGRGKAPWVVSVEPLPREMAALLDVAGGRSICLDLENSELKPPQLGWAAILRTLRAEGIESVMVEGGGSVINSLLSTENAHLVDSVVLTIAPTWLGQGGVVVSPQRPTNDHNDSLPVARLQKVTWHQLGDDAVLCGALHS